jgi:hypothetical protein
MLVSACFPQKVGLPYFMTGIGAGSRIKIKAGAA